MGRQGGREEIEQRRKILKSGALMVKGRKKKAQNFSTLSAGEEGAFKL